MQLLIYNLCRKIDASLEPEVEFEFELSVEEMIVHCFCSWKYGFSGMKDLEERSSTRVLRVTHVRALVELFCY